MAKPIRDPRRGWRMRYRPAQRFTPRSMLVQGEPPPAQAPGVGELGRIPAAQSFVPDGMIYPRQDVTFFDVTVREPSIPVSATTLRTAFTQEERIKAGWIRYLGYEFNNPHGFFQVRTSLLVNGGVSSNYIFKTVDSSLPTGQYQGSFPTAQIGTIEQPTSIFVSIPSNALIQIRFINNSFTEVFSATVRLVGWSFGN